MSRPRQPTPARVRAQTLIAACMLGALGCGDFRPPERPEPMQPATTPGMDAAVPQPPPPAFTMQPAIAEGDPRLTHAQVGDGHIFIPDPVDHAVTVIALEDLSSQELRAGVRPDFLAVAPGRDLAVVLDTATDTAHVIELSGGELARTQLPVVARANAVAFTPDAQHAVVYFDPENRLAGGEAAEHQSLTHIDLRGAPVATDVGMGMSPTRVELATAPPRAYLQRGSAIARVDLERPSPLAQAIDTGTAGATVELFADAGLALSYYVGGPSLTVVDLESDARHPLWIEALDGLGPDDDAGVAGDATDATVGAATVEQGGDVIAVTVAERGTLLRLRWPQIADDSGAFTRHALNTDGPQRLFAGDGGRLIVLGGRADRAADPSVILWSPVQVDGALQYGLPSAGLDARAFEGGDGALVRHADGYTLVSRRAERSSFRRAEGPATATREVGDALFVIVPQPRVAADEGQTADASVADPTTEAGGRPSIDRVALSDLETRRIYVDSAPRGLDATADGSRLVIDQEHPGGRITILDLTADTRRTLSGFHVNDRVQDVKGVKDGKE